MGANYVDYTFEASDEATLKRNFNERAEQDRFEHGAGAYSGTLQHTFRIVAQTFKTINDAEVWVQNNTRKWEPAFAVKVGDFSKALFNTTKGNKLITQINDLRVKLENFDKDLLKKLATQKSLYKGCTNCGSKISVKHFVKGTSTFCPVCSKELVKSAKDIEKLKSLQESYIQKNQELKDMKKEYNKKVGDKAPCWYIGGWAAS